MGPKTRSKLAKSDINQICTFCSNVLEPQITEPLTLLNKQTLLSLLSHRYIVPNKLWIFGVTKEQSKEIVNQIKNTEIDGIKYNNGTQNLKIAFINPKSAATAMLSHFFRDKSYQT